ncbi:hypothetical protein [Burkholderia gladioli]|uniref:hypothetical protein n=1 Tax=Burkholderia gladioli TaxID=28095 RepID=UPI00163F4489|nr:hypothetical protein [Burkholderia gladioli]
MKNYITNFPLVECFGCDGSDPEIEPWKGWFSGADPLLGRNLAEPLWWHFCEILSHFEQLTCQHLGISSLSYEALEATLYDHLSLAEFIRGGSLAPVNIYKLESVMMDGGVKNNAALKLSVLAYCVWCVDRLIDALHVSDAMFASLMISNVFCATKDLSNR